jgi:hypothetical protein
MCVNTRALDLVYVHALDDTVYTYSTMRRVLRARLGRHRLERDEDPRAWLDPLGGAQCECAAGEHTDSCFVWVHDGATPNSAAETCGHDQLYPVALSCRDGNLRVGGTLTDVTFLAIDEPFDNYGYCELFAVDIEWPTPAGPLKGVDTTTLLGLSFADLEISLASRTKRDAAWERQIGALTSTSIIYAYSYCSLVKTNGVTKLSYGYVTGGLADPALLVADDPTIWPALDASKGDFSLLERGAWGGGIVSGPQTDMSTARGEAFGILALLVHTMQLLDMATTPKTLRVWSFCDNKGDCDKFNGDPDVHGDYEHNGADPDVWALMFRLKGKYCVRVSAINGRQIGTTLLE